MDVSQFESFIFDKMSDTNLPGVSAALTDDQQIIYSNGFGFRDLEGGLPSTEKTLYGIGSITKSFTALSIMQLQEREKLDTDDPVKDYLPLKIDPKGQPVLIKHLLTHSSGIPALAYAESSIRRAIGAGENWTPIANVDDMFTFLNGAGDWTYSEPGERWFYLNEGYVLLGAIIEQCSDLPYEEYVKQNILSPLEMNRTFFSKKEVEEDQDAATPHILSKDGEQIPSDYPWGGISADGALISSVEDLSRYIQMYLKGGKVGDTRIVSEESMEQMKTPGVPTPAIEGPFGDSGYGFGLRITEDFFGRELVSHGGSVLVSTGYLGFIPEENLGVALLANGNGYPLSNFGMLGLALMMGKDVEDCPFISRERTLEELEGIYETYKGTMQAEVKKIGDLLQVKVEDKFTKNTTQLIPEQLDERRRQFFYLDGGNKMPATFEVTDGEVDLLFERYRLKKTRR
ncbi:MAG: serine hydrolase [Candidatus Acetothermia bacterium]